jgi:uncharacterized damage-inducible protein DinB
MQIPKWTTRKFNFDYPSEMFPVILERLRGTPARIESMTRELPKEKLTEPGPGNAWSIQEHVGHLIDLDELHDGRIDDFNNGSEVLRAADMENKKTYAADHNNRNIEELLREFHEARNHFISRLEKLDPEKSALHPRLQKPMRVVDMAFFVAEHDDHHLALMRQLINRY